MITSQDIEKMTVSELRKLASQKGLTHIPCDRPEKADANGQIRTGHANRVELLAVFTPQKQLELSMFQLTDEELVEVQSAMDVSKMSLLELAKAGLLLKTRRINTDYSKVASLTPEQRKQTTLAGAANANLRVTADSIVRWNHAQYNNDLRVYLNASILRNLTGSNLNTIKDFLSVYRTPDDFLHSPDEHNQHYGLTDKDNRKGRDEFGNKIKISELIKQVAPTEKPQAEVQETPNQSIDSSVQETFAQRIDKLESELEIKTECELLMEALVKENGSKSFASFKKLVTPYRTEIQELRLRSHNTYTHEYQSPRSTENFKDGVPKGAQMNDEGKVVSEPRHSALKFLSPDLYKERFAK
jgi:hypothetical protein